MRPAVLLSTLAIFSTLAVGAAWFAACTGTSTPASPTSPAPVSTTLPSDDSGSTSPADGGSADAGSCGDAGSAVTAKFDFAATKVVNGGKGQVLTVNVCDTITWVNDDNGVPHGVVSIGDGGFFFNTGTVTGTDGGAPLTP